ncbi:MAG: S41 family peptidase [Planctomycetota bacterium]
MTHSLRFRFATVLVLVICVLAPLAKARGQEDPTADPKANVTAEIERITKRYGAGDLARAWQGAAQLEELGPAILPWATEQLATAPEAQSDAAAIPLLMVAKSLLALGETEPVEKALLALGAAFSLSVPVRSAALELLGEFPGERAEKLLTEILAGDEQFDASLRIAAARSLFQVSGEYKAVRTFLRPLLEVDDAAVRNAAALALGEMDNLDGPVKRILLSLEKEPTSAGAQARLILAHERRLRSLERRLEAKEPDLPTGGEGVRLERELEQTTRQLEEKRQQLEDIRQQLAQGRLNHPLVNDLLQLVLDNYVDPALADPKALVVEAAKGMIASLDPFSMFMDVKETKEFYESIAGEYAGIGAQVGKDKETDFLIILRPIYGGPAYQAGLLTDDKIISIGGVSTKGLNLEEILKKLKGDAGATAQLEVHRRGWKEPRKFDIQRKMIRLESVATTVLPGKIGYLSLSQFGDDAVTEFENGIQSLLNDGVNAVVLDLRNNGGGYMEAAVSIVDMFVGDQKDPIVSQRDIGRRMSPKQHFAKPPHLGDFPLIVLINEGSASAAEIVSGALQDFGRATLVGERSFGKGSVQQLLNLPEGTNALLGGPTKLRLTVQYYFLPSGRSIHTQRDAEGRVIEEGGVKPDIEVVQDAPPLWRLEALNRLVDKNAFRDYLEKHPLKDNGELYRVVAELGDGGSTSTYPGFDEHFSPLNTDRAEVDDIRRYLRREIRRLVMDERGKEFACDYSDDIQLQRAILELLKKLGTAPESIVEYKTFAKVADKGG